MKPPQPGFEPATCGTCCPAVWSCLLLAGAAPAILVLPQPHSGASLAPPRSPSTTPSLPRPPGPHASRGNRVMASGGPTLDSSEDDGDPPWQERQPVRNGSTLVVYFPMPPAIECCELGCGATYNPATWTFRGQSLERHLEAEHGRNQNNEHLVHLLVMRRPLPAPVPKVPKVLPRKVGPSQSSTVALEGGGEAGQAKRRHRCSDPTATHQRHRLYQPPPAGLAQTCHHSGDTLSGAPSPLQSGTGSSPGETDQQQQATASSAQSAAAVSSPQQVLPTLLPSGVEDAADGPADHQAERPSSPSDEYCSPAEEELPEQTAGRAIGSPPPPSPEAMTPRRVDRHSGSTYGTQEEVADTA
ncbi:hypothetical protein HPB51_004918 [Rhipicephalus microplus]|uniref:C2H2-type domain-containing protein n=1 Tax=Rhipicephalus microplus TaxID=6941 RepID=A0A9J6EFC7_RHIMP|nr:hypothetical protein HPB51_004918 [Rhipicephalus microplus]